ncbi:MAG: hypothetical protein GC179_21575 [Anaerolineaceae bacterium]|nr:hypothetical protein [Anaerolineaceae bacterium]
MVVIPESTILSFAEVSICKYVEDQVSNLGTITNYSDNWQTQIQFWHNITHIIANYLQKASEEAVNHTIKQKLLETSQIYLALHLSLSKQSSVVENAHKWWLIPKYKLIDRNLASFYLSSRIITNEKDIWSPLDADQIQYREKTLNTPQEKISSNWTKIPLASKFRNVKLIYNSNQA